MFLKLQQTSKKLFAAEKNERLTERAEVNKCPGIWVKEGFAYEGLKTWFNGYDEGFFAIDKLAEYEDLEEQGLLLRLPCKVGDTVYVIAQGYSFGEVGDNADKWFCIHIEKFTVNMIEHIGKTIFLTKSEAKKKISELKENSR